ncbi:MAG: DUF58 domain-containing protein, partial [Planctomycetota bacterium]
MRQLSSGLLAPWRFYESLRRSMTLASVMAMLCLLMTLNVIWGFPWSGMMGGCVAMLFAGFAINRFMSPKLRLSLSVPRSSAVGHPFALSARLENQRSLPALNLRVGWQREGTREVFERRTVTPWEASPPVSVEVLRGNDVLQWHGQMRFNQRGVYDVPPFQVSSSFPFHLFYRRKSIPTDTQIAVTPAPLSSDQDPASRVLLTKIGEWAKQLVVGAPVEYVGNREYEVGMPVRRWDFASWARLGRPIVREYHAPSIQAVTLLVDTSVLPAENQTRAQTKRQRQIEAISFERLMSAATTAISEMLHRRIQLKLIVPCEDEANNETSSLHAADSKESLLIRLAEANPISNEDGIRFLEKTLESRISEPMLILTRVTLDAPSRRHLASLFPS